MRETPDFDVPDARLDLRVQAHIGKKLKQYYDGIVAEPIPDKFKQLLDKLEGGGRTYTKNSESNR